MSVVEINFPEERLFTTDITVHENYINRGNHVGNSRYVDICNEATLRFFLSRGVPEYTVGEQVLININFTVQLLAEAKYAEILIVDIGVDNFHRRGCDFIFRMASKNTNNLVAMACLSFLSFDYQLGKVVDAAESFQSFFTVSR